MFLLLFFFSLLWVSRLRLISCGTLTQSHFRTIEMEGKESAMWIIHPGRYHMLVSAWTVMQSSHVACNLHMPSLTSPLVCQINILNTIFLIPNSWVSTPMSDLLFHLLYFSQWKLNSYSCLGERPAAIQAPYFSLTISGGHTLGCTPWFCPLVSISLWNPLLLSVSGE